MNRWRLVVSWIFLGVGCWGAVILLLASPITAAIWADAGVFEPWNVGKKVSWYVNLVTVVRESWRWLAMVVAFAGLAGLGAYLQPPAVAPRARRGDWPK